MNETVRGIVGEFRDLEWLKIKTDEGSVLEFSGSSWCFQVG